MFPLLLALLACEGPPPETDLAGQSGPIGAPDAAAGVEARAVRVEGERSSRIEVTLADGRTVIVADEGNPDRVALAPDASHVAWVSGATGLASIYVAPVTDPAPARQLTNVGLEDHPRTPGQPPEGWVPPPHDDSLHFEGDTLVWNSPQGPQQVVWR